ncbi:hypothetical protein [Metallosphaera cuprina]|uniref:Uncharacterized protein n=1 Tax=Metallosphaera cuprina (strain Ar-4) TaxID=1006006 RepID=F4G2U1_METCR|nr:hypothetical protein [Metallosphaera cuprina]AEB95139.1 hypothetical protein Mcup_1034 [Metallosphaera cuprina Ar-4]
MNDQLKIFIVSLLIMLIVSMIVTVEASRVSVSPGRVTPPYAEVTEAVINDGKVTVTISVKNEGYNVSVTGGYVQIYNTGQTVNVSPTGSLTFNVSFPLTTTIVNLGTVTVLGVLKGYMNGNPIYISFSSPVNLNVIISAQIVNFTYYNYTLTFYLKVSTPVNITLVKIGGLSLVNSNLSSIVVRMPAQFLDQSLPPGLDYVKEVFNVTHVNGSETFDKDLRAGYAYYIVSSLYSTLNTTPPSNYTFNLYCIERY